MTVPSGAVFGAEPVITVSLIYSPPLEVGIKGLTRLFYRAPDERWVAVRPLEGRWWSVEQEGTKVLLTSDEGRYILSDYAIRFTPEAGERIMISGRAYTGEIEFWPDKTETRRLKVINRIKLEEYVLGALNGEAYLDWHPEALAAIAIAVRSYALHNLGKHQGFDLCDQEHCQKFLGLSPNAIFQQAVERTRGMALFWRRQVINAVHHSSSGGWTQNNEEIWEGEPLPYLRGVEDFDQEGAKYRWARSFLFSREELASRLGLPADGRLAVRAVFSGEKRSGLEFAGEDGRQVRLRSEELRRVFGLPSPNFQALLIPEESLSQATVAYEGINLGLQGAKDGFLILEAETLTGIDGQELVEWHELTSREMLLFTGKGSGHGVGLSQWGAQGMAEKGYDYRSILRHYYGDEVELGFVYHK